MSMSIPFERGQQFVSADPRDEGRTVQIVSAGHHRPGTVYVGTVSDTGKLLRQRWMSKAVFHDSAVTGKGEPRKTGYILIREEGN